MKIKDGKSVEQKITELKKDPNVEYAEPNYIRNLAIIGNISSNDTHKNNLWGLDNIGQVVNSVSGTNDADIDAPEAWAVNEGTNASAIVAVIDTGVAYKHPDLFANMWDGTNCKDDTGVFLGGCNHGYDYEDNDKTPLPTTSSHGTHIAGTIAAVKNNSKGIIGVAPNAKIMAIKSDLDVASIIKSIDFAIQNGAKIINASFGGTTFSQSEYDAIGRFRTAGGIFVAAAGNQSTNNESAHFYPSDYDLDNIISVAATDQDDALASFSNYGAASVDLGAPGKNIYSTVSGESTKLSEDFEKLTPPAVPADWTKGGSNNDWGTYQLDDGSFWGNVLYGDINNIPYESVANSTITSPPYDLSAGGANIDFWARCDTEYNTTAWTDYMALEFSGDGGNTFTEFLKWDEPLIDSDTNSSGGAVYHFENLSIPSAYSTGNFKFRMRWVANGNADTGNGDGCLVDDVKITQFSDGSDEQYDYLQGTSMAAPHVAGLAALIGGYNSGLSVAEVKNIILSTGDSLYSLLGKTVSGKRINASNALNSLVPATYTISGTVKYYDEVKVVPDATVVLEDEVGNQLATTTTDTNGFYEFTGVANGGNYVVRVSKSDNASGLTSADQIKIGRHIVGLELFDTIYKNIAGDVNNSGGLTSADQIKIGRFIVSLDPDLPSGTWKFYSSDAEPIALDYLTLEPTRSITDITADSPNRDFIGAKMGDVNNSWVSS